MVVVALGDGTGGDFDRVRRAVGGHLVELAAGIEHEPLAVRGPVRGLYDVIELLDDLVCAAFQVIYLKIAVHRCRVLGECHESSAGKQRKAEDSFQIHIRL